MFTMNELYFGMVPQKLACARTLYERAGEELLARPDLRRMLRELTVLSAALQLRMGEMSMFSLCRSCAARPGGGCCSAYMANETDALLLLLNMLLGVEVAAQREDTVECCFLGQEGCILTVKPIFCLNYNCSHILTGNGAEVLQDLEKAASAVLLAQTAVEKMLLERLLRR
jgi:hypothetical protein